MAEAKVNEKPIEIPRSELSDEVLDAIIESFVLREGTDYGRVEQSLDSKKAQILRQIDRGDLVIVFEQSTETVTLANMREWRKNRAFDQGMDLN